MKGYVWNKIGKIIPVESVARPDWSQEYFQAPNTILLEDRLRVFFCSREFAANGQYISRVGFCDFSRDGNFTFMGYSPNPLIELGKSGAFDEFGTYPLSVHTDGDLTFGVYGGWTRCFSVPFDVSLGLVVSRDLGESFQKVQEEPILTKCQDEPFIISSPKLRKYDGVWYLYYIAGEKWKIDNSRIEPVYKIRLATSTDLIHWQRHGKNLIESKLFEEAQASPDVFELDGSYHMYFCYRETSNTKEIGGGYRIGYARSENLFDWIREDSSAGIEIGPDTWDSLDISYPHFFTLNKKNYLLYLGNEVGKYFMGFAQLEKLHC
jgi:hypothetical protein